jgi:hypothetical protein
MTYSLINRILNLFYSFLFVDIFVVNFIYYSYCYLIMNCLLKEYGDPQVTSQKDLITLYSNQQCLVSFVFYLFSLTS